MAYPVWTYYPNRDRPPDWVHSFTKVIEASQPSIDSASALHLTSDAVLGHLRPGLEALGYQVETGKNVAGKVRRPVLFGENGRERLAYEIDAVHDDLGIVVEIEAGRGARGNAVHRDIIRASLIVGAQYLAIGVMAEYRHQSGGREMVVKSYADARAQLDAIYASGRLALPFSGVLLFGY
jgi:hypothetical protein